MNVAIMQPYLFPYLGYFNLIHASDLFIFLDDVQHIRRGWVNRNRIWQGGGPVTFTVPLAKASRETAINEQHTSREEYPRFCDKFAKQLQAAYGRAPYYAPARELALDVLHAGHANLAKLAERSVKAVLDYVGLRRVLEPASSLPAPVRGEGLAGPERLIHIAKALGAGQYVNPPGGRSLYAPEPFAAAGLRLRFVTPALERYDRPGEWVPGLSVIDALMYASPERLLALIENYTLDAQDVTT